MLLIPGSLGGSAWTEAVRRVPESSIAHATPHANPTNCKIDRFIISNSLRNGIFNVSPCPPSTSPCSRSRSAARGGIQGSTTRPKTVTMNFGAVGSSVW